MIGAGDGVFLIKLDSGEEVRCTRECFILLEEDDESTSPGSAIASVEFNTPEARKLRKDITLASDFSSLLDDVDTIFFVISDLFTPYAYAPPWTPLNPGVYSIFGGLPKHLLVLHDSPPWKVALCLAYPTAPSPPRYVSTGWNDQL